MRVCVCMCVRVCDLIPVKTKAWHFVLLSSSPTKFLVGLSKDGPSAGKVAYKLALLEIDIHWLMFVVAVRTPTTR